MLAYWRQQKEKQNRFAIDEPERKRIKAGVYGLLQLISFPFFNLPFEILIIGTRSV